MSAVAPQFRRPPRAARPVPIRWFSGRSLLLHLTLVVAVPVCLLAGWWQVQRALGGNTLSFVYVFEWPAFAVVAVWAWWALLTSPTRDPQEPGPANAGGRGGGRPGPGLLAARTRALRWDPQAESPRLRAYNTYLAELSAGPAPARKLRRPPGGRRE